MNRKRVRRMSVLQYEFRQDANGHFILPRQLERMLADLSYENPISSYTTLHFLGMQHMEQPQQPSSSSSSGQSNWKKTDHGTWVRDTSPRSNQIQLQPFKDPHVAPSERWSSPQDQQRALDIHQKLQAIREVHGGIPTGPAMLRMEKHNQALREGKLDIKKIGEAERLLEESRQGENQEKSQFTEQIRNLTRVQEGEPEKWSISKPKQERQTKAQYKEKLLGAQDSISQWYDLTTRNATRKNGREVTSQEIRKFIPNLSHEQLAAVTSRADVTEVQAGPGTGKSTLMMTQFIDDVINRDANPNDYLFLSKTHSAVENMRNMLKGTEKIIPNWNPEGKGKKEKKEKEKKNTPDQFRTLDSLGLGLLMKTDTTTKTNVLQRMDLSHFSPLYQGSPRDREMKIQDLEEQKQQGATKEYLEKVMRHYKISPKFSNSQDLDTHITLTKSDRSGGIYDERFAKGKEIYKKGEWQSDAQVQPVDPDLMLYLYEQTMKHVDGFRMQGQQGAKFDINDVPYLVQLAIHGRKKMVDGVETRVNGGHIPPLKRYMVDEHQDMSPEQARMMAALTGKETRGFFGGDMSQMAIQRRWGLDQTMQQQFAGKASSHELTANYRSGPHTGGVLNQLNQLDIMEDIAKSPLQVAMGEMDKPPVVTMENDFPQLYRTMINDWMKLQGTDIETMKGKMAAGEHPLQGLNYPAQRAPFAFQMSREGKGVPVFKKVLEEMLGKEFTTKYYSEETPREENVDKIHAMKIAQLRSRDVDHLFGDVTRGGKWDAVGYVQNLYTMLSRAKEQNHMYASKTNYPGSAYDVTPSSFIGQQVPPGFHLLLQGMTRDMSEVQGVPDDEIAPGLRASLAFSLHGKKDESKVDLGLTRQALEDMIFLNEHYQPPVGSGSGIIEGKLDMSKTDDNGRILGDMQRKGLMNAAVVAGQFERSGDSTKLELSLRNIQSLISRGNVAPPAERWLSRLRNPGIDGDKIFQPMSREKALHLGIPLEERYQGRSSTLPIMHATTYPVMSQSASSLNWRSLQPSREIGSFLTQGQSVPSLEQFLADMKSMTGREKIKYEDVDFEGDGPNKREIHTPFDPGSMYPASHVMEEVENEQKDFAPRDSQHYEGMDVKSLRQSMLAFLEHPEAMAHPVIGSMLQEQLTNPRLIEDVSRISKSQAPKWPGMARLSKYLQLGQKPGDEVEQEFQKLTQRATPLSKDEHQRLAELNGLRQEGTRLTGHEVETIRQLSERTNPIAKEEQDRLRELTTLRNYTGNQGLDKAMNAVMDPAHPLNRVKGQPSLHSAWLKGIVEEKTRELFSKGHLEPQLMEKLATVAEQIADGTEHPEHKKFFRDKAETFRAYQGFELDREGGSTVTREDIERIGKTHPFHAATLDSMFGSKIRQHGSIKMENEAGAIAKYLYHQSIVMRRIKTPQQGQILGIPTSISNLAPALTEFRLLISALNGGVEGRRGGIVDSMAVSALPLHDQAHESSQDEDFSFQQYGAGVGLDNYGKRLREMLNPKSGMMQDAHRQDLQRQLGDVEHISSTMNDPLWQLNSAQLMRGVLRATTGKSVMNVDQEMGEDDKIGKDPITKFFAPIKSGYREGTRTLESLKQFISVLSEASAHVEKTGTIKRSQIINILSAFGHSPDDNKFGALRLLEQKHGFRPNLDNPDPSLNFKTLVEEEFDGEKRKRLLSQITRTPLLPGVQYRFMGGEKGFAGLTKNQMDAGISAGLEGTLGTLGKDDFGKSKWLSEHISQGMIPQDKFHEIRKLVDKDKDAMMRRDEAPIMQFQVPGGKSFPVIPDQLMMVPGQDVSGGVLPWHTPAQPDVVGPLPGSRSSGQGKTYQSFLTNLYESQPDLTKKFSPLFQQSHQDWFAQWNREAKRRKEGKGNTLPPLNWLQQLEQRRIEEQAYIQHNAFAMLRTSSTSTEKSRVPWKTIQSFLKGGGTFKGKVQEVTERGAEMMKQGKFFEPPTNMVKWIDAPYPRRRIREMQYPKRSPEELQQFRAERANLEAIGHSWKGWQLGKQRPSVESGLSSDYDQYVKAHEAKQPKPKPNPHEYDLPLDPNEKHSALKLKTIIGRMWNKWLPTADAEGKGGGLNAAEPRWILAKPAYQTHQEPRPELPPYYSKFWTNEETQTQLPMPDGKVILDALQQKQAQQHQEATMARATMEHARPTQPAPVQPVEQMAEEPSRALVPAPGMALMAEPAPMPESDAFSFPVPNFQLSGGTGGSLPGVMPMSAPVVGGLLPMEAISLQQPTSTALGPVDAGPVLPSMPMMGMDGMFLPPSQALEQLAAAASSPERGEGLLPVSSPAGNMADYQSPFFSRQQMAQAMQGMVLSVQDMTPMRGASPSPRVEPDIQEGIFSEGGEPSPLKLLTAPKATPISHPLSSSSFKVSSDVLSRLEQPPIAPTSLPSPTHEEAFTPTIRKSPLAPSIGMMISRGRYSRPSFGPHTLPPQELTLHKSPLAPPLGLDYDRGRYPSPLFNPRSLQTQSHSLLTIEPPNLTEQEVRQVMKQQRLAAAPKNILPFLPHLSPSPMKLVATAAPGGTPSSSPWAHTSRPQGTIAPPRPIPLRGGHGGKLRPANFLQAQVRQSKQPWYQLQKGLSPEQQGVFDDQSQHLLVQGGPGSGKSSTFVKKMGEMILRQGLKPDKVVTVSPMHSGVEALNKQYNETLRPMIPQRPGASGLRDARTIHGLAHDVMFGGGDLDEQTGKMVYPNLEKIGMGHIQGILADVSEEELLRNNPESNNLLLRQGTVPFLQEALSQHPVDVPSKKKLGDFLKDIGNYKKGRMEAGSEYQEAMKVGPEHLKQGLVTKQAALAAYQQHMGKEGLIDFDDYPILGAQVLQQQGAKAVPSSLQGLQLLGIDEAQDTTPAAMNFFEQVVKAVGGGTRMLVGMDPMQGLLEDLGAIAPGKVVDAYKGLFGRVGGTSAHHQLNTNFRSDKAAVALNNAILGTKTMKKEKGVSALQVPHAGAQMGKKENITLANSDVTLNKRMFRSMMDSTGVDKQVIAANLQAGKGAFEGVDWSQKGLTKPSEIPGIFLTKNRRDFFEHMAGKTMKEDYGVTGAQGDAAVKEMMRHGVPGLRLSEQTREAAETQFPLGTPSQFRGLQFEKPHMDVTRTGAWWKEDKLVSYLRNLFVGVSRVKEGGQNNIFATNRPFQAFQQEMYKKNVPFTESEPDIPGAGVVQIGSGRKSILTPSEATKFGNVGGKAVPNGVFQELLPLRDKELAGNTPAATSPAPQPLTITLPPGGTVSIQGTSPKVTIPGGPVSISTPSSGGAAASTPLAAAPSSSSPSPVTPIPPSSVGPTPVAPSPASTFISPLGSAIMGMAGGGGKKGTSSGGGGGKGKKGKGSGDDDENDEGDESTQKKTDGPSDNERSPFNNMTSNFGRTMTRIGYEMQFIGKLFDSITTAAAGQGSEYRRASMAMPGSGGGPTGDAGFFDFGNAQSGISQMSEMTPMYSKVRIAQTLKEQASLTGGVKAQPGATSSILALSALSGMDPTQLTGQMGYITGSMGAGKSQGATRQLAGSIAGLYNGNLTELNVAPTMQAISGVLPTLQGIQLGGGSQLQSLMGIFKAALGSGMTAQNLPDVSKMVGSLANIGTTPDLAGQQFLNALFPGQTTANPQLMEYQKQQVDMSGQIQQMQLQATQLPQQMSINNAELSIQQANLQLSQQELGLQGANLKLDKAELNIQEASLNLEKSGLQLQAQGINLNQQSLGLSREQLGLSQAQFAHEQKQQEQQYGPIGGDVSRQAYFSFMRNQMAAGYNPLSAETGTQFKSAPTMGLENAKFFAGIEHQRQTSVLGRSSLMSDALFQENQKYLNEQEAFYEQENKQRNEDRAFQKDAGQKNLAIQAKQLDIQQSHLNISRQQLGLSEQRLGLSQQSLDISKARLNISEQQFGISQKRLGLEQQRLGLDVQRNQMQNEQLQLQMKLLPQQIAAIENLQTAMQQFADGQGPVNGKNLQPEDIIRQLSSIKDDAQLKHIISLSRLPPAEQNTLYESIKQVQKEGGFDKVKASTTKDDKDLKKKLDDLLKGGAFTDQKANSALQDAYLNYGGQGGIWTSFAKKFDDANTIWKGIAQTLAFSNQYLKEIATILNVAGPVFVGIGMLLNSVGFGQGVAGLLKNGGAAKIATGVGKVATGIGTVAGKAGGGIGAVLEGPVGAVAIPLAIAAGGGFLTKWIGDQMQSALNKEAVHPGSAQIKLPSWMDWAKSPGADNALKTVQKRNEAYRKAHGGKAPPPVDDSDNMLINQVGKGIGNFFTKTIPDVWNGIWGGGGNNEKAIAHGGSGADFGVKPHGGYQAHIVTPDKEMSASIKKQDTQWATLINKTIPDGWNKNIWGPSGQLFGKTIPQGWVNNFWGPAGQLFGKTIPQGWTNNFWGPAGQLFGKTIPNGWTQNVWGPAGNFFNKVLPSWWNTWVGGPVGNFFNKVLPTWWNTWVGGPIGNFFSKTLPTWWNTWVGGPVGNFFTKTLPNWWNTWVGAPASQLFNKTIPDGWNKNVVGPVGTYFSKTLPDWWNKHIGDPVTTFFSKTLPKIFTDTLGKINLNPFSSGGGGGPYAPAKEGGGAPAGFSTPQVTTQFGTPMSYGFKHQGVDFAASQGTPLEAFDGGTVTGAGFQPWGGEVDVNIGGGMTERYLHLSNISVHNGEKIKRGDFMGLTGGGTPASGLGFWSSGPHSHVQIDRGNILGGINPWPIWAALGDRNLLQYYQGGVRGAGADFGGGGSDGTGGLAGPLPLHKIGKQDRAMNKPAPGRHLATGGVAMTPSYVQVAEQEAEAIVPLSKLSEMLKGLSGASVNCPHGAHDGGSSSLSNKAGVVIQNLIGQAHFSVTAGAGGTLSEQEQDKLMSQLLDILTDATKQLLGKLQ